MISSDYVGSTWLTHIEYRAIFGQKPKQNWKKNNIVSKQRCLLAFSLSVFKDYYFPFGLVCSQTYLFSQALPRLALASLQSPALALCFAFARVFRGSTLHRHLGVKVFHKLFRRTRFLLKLLVVLSFWTTWVVLILDWTRTALRAGWCRNQY